VTREDDVTGRDAQDKGAHTGKWRRESGRARRDAEELGQHQLRMSELWKQDWKARTLGQRESTGINGQAHLRTAQDIVRQEQNTSARKATQARNADGNGIAGTREHSFLRTTGLKRSCTLRTPAQCAGALYCVPTFPLRFSSPLPYSLAAASPLLLYGSERLAYRSDVTTRVLQHPENSSATYATTVHILGRRTDCLTPSCLAPSCLAPSC
jgi:hypothetical protein